MTDYARKTGTQRGMYCTVLPGPSRRRIPGLYWYSLLYRTDDPSESGCAALWAVQGGRSAYQVALERDDVGRYAWHCSCPDAIYRAEGEGRTCKHVSGLRDMLPALPVASWN